MNPHILIIILTALLLPLNALAQETKVISVSPDKKIEVFTKNPSVYLEKARPHAKDRIIGEGIFARFVGSDSPPCTLWSPDDSSAEAYVEWDPNSTRLFIRQGDEKAWDTRMFILRQDVRTGHLFFQQPDFPALEPLLYLKTDIALSDQQSPWRFAITDWEDPAKCVLSLFLLDDFGRVLDKEGCQVRFYFASTNLHEFKLQKIDYTGVLPSESERWYEEGESPYRDKAKVIYQAK